MLAVKNKVLESALRSLLELNESGDEIDVASDSINFFEKLSRLEVDLILLDWGFFSSKTVEIIKLIKHDYPLINLICMDIHHENIKNALNASADGFFFKSDPPCELLRLIGDFRTG